MNEVHTNDNATHAGVGTRARDDCASEPAEQPTVVFVLPSDKGHFLYTKHIAKLLSETYAIEVYAPATAADYAPECASFHPLTDANDDRFDRMTKKAMAVASHGSDPDPQKACDEAEAYYKQHIEEALGEEFAAEFASGKGMHGLQGPRENLIALKERVLRPDVALVIWDDAHVYRWIGAHCKEFGVPSLALVPSPLYLWRPEDSHEMNPDNLDDEPKYGEVEGLRVDKARVPHAKCYTLFPRLLPLGADEIPGILAGPILPDEGVPREQAEAFEASDLKRWIEQGERPVVYVCFGSMLRGHPLIEEIWPKIMREAADHGKYRMLYAGWVPPGAGVRPGEEEALRLEAWVPQAAVLAHPTVRCFISHCGASSVNEAIGNGKPIIALPFFHDQRFNGMKVVEMGAATACLMKDDFEPAEAKAAIEEALTSAKVKDNLRGLSEEIKACRGLQKVCDEAERLIAEAKNIK
uniref:Glycosyltransferase n=1 Tax=Chloropicon laureae TaxID=464258 RepID=A0A7S3E2R5_9CHLO|mmetsp:Transcript_4188/g.10563  ORF Transcript_4188/g.10563 Transcript_4188/m.10563 type:complete len:467 (+) Transcript_4188:24-1424(+)